MRLYEAHLPVSDVQRSITFYTEVVGLTPGLLEPERNAAFLYVGDAESGMLGIWGPEAPYGWKGGQKFKSHFAIGVSLEQLLAIIPELKAKGIETLGFYGEAADEPSVIGWMPSAQIYFRDPDGHSVEFITILNDTPDPDFMGSLSEWQSHNHRRGQVTA